MATNFPTTLDSFSEIDCDTTVEPKDRSNDHSDAIVALETKVGENASTDNSSIDYKLTNAASVDPGHKHNATSINVDTTGFSNNLTGADDTVQKALDTLDALAVVSDDWQSISTTATYASASDPVFQVYLSGDQTGTVQRGLKVQCTNNSTTFYGIIHGVSAYDAGNNRTPIWIYGGVDNDLVNSAITDFKVSKLRAPLGFDMRPGRWSLDLSQNAANISTPGSNTYNQVATYDYKIGEWICTFSTTIQLTESGATGLYFRGYAYPTSDTAAVPSGIFLSTIENQKFGPVNSTNNDLTMFYSITEYVGFSANGTGGIYLYSASASGIDTVRVGLNTLRFTSAYL